MNGAKTFQSTLPTRGATKAQRTPRYIGVGFNLRSPHGERRQTLQFEIKRLTFQSTLPTRGATAIGAVAL